MTPVRRGSWSLKKYINHYKYIVVKKQTINLNEMMV